MQWGTQSKGGGGDNIFVDKAKIVDCNITYGEKKNWQTYADDISIELTLDVGKDFTPSMYIGGKFKSDDVSGLIVGWGTAFKVKMFFDAIKRPISLDKTKTAAQTRLPEGAENIVKGNDFLRLTYKSTKLKQDGSNRWKEWQETRSVDTNIDSFKKDFKNSVTNNWVKDFLAPGTDVPFDTDDTYSDGMPL